VHTYARASACGFVCTYAFFMSAHVHTRCACACVCTSVCARLCHNLLSTCESVVCPAWVCEHMCAFCMQVCAHVGMEIPAPCTLRAPLVHFKTYIHVIGIVPLPGCLPVLALRNGEKLSLNFNASHYYLIYTSNSGKRKVPVHRGINLMPDQSFKR
jgi:hypothetical protein